MNATAQINPDKTVPNSDEETREVALGLAADLIERGLQSPFTDLFMILLQIMDSRLISKEDTWHGCVVSLYHKGDKLSCRCASVFPLSRNGGASQMRMKCRTLAEEVDFYRQEQFWHGKGAASLLQAEAVISELFAYFEEAEFLMRQIDQDQPDYRVQRRYRVPERTPNPYEAIDHD